MLFAFLPWFRFQEAKSQESKEAPKPAEEAKSEDENDSEKVQEADDRGTAIDLRLIITIRLLAQRTFLPSSQLRQILDQVRSQGCGKCQNASRTVESVPPVPLVLVFTSAIVDIPARSPAQVHKIDHKYVGLVIGKASP